jgi:bifunctional oligoribonuclease and PAP phosphatase NrnA
MDTSRKIISEIEASRSILVAAHRNPEGDALGSSLAFFNLFGKDRQVQVFNLDPVPYFLEFLPGADRVAHDIKKIKPFELAIVVDCSNLSRVCDQFPEYLAGKKIINIDHHETSDNFGMLNLVEPKASSTGEILYRLFAGSGLTINKETATCLYVAISTDTGSFQYQNTTQETLDAAAGLVRLGARPAEISHNLYERHPKSRLLLLSQVMQTVKFSESGQRAEMTLTKEMFEKAQAGPAMAEGFINFLTSAAGVEIAILFRQLAKEKYKVSFRSSEKFNVAKLCEKFGGGGHSQAAGATLEGSLEDIQKLIRKEVDDLIAGTSK